MRKKKIVEIKKRMKKIVRESNPYLKYKKRSEMDAFFIYQNRVLCREI